MLSLKAWSRSTNQKRNSKLNPKQMFNLSQRSEENTNTQRTIVRLTSDYDMFKHIAGNRELSTGNINAIAAQIQLRGQQQPIIVNERYEIIDGQHRLEACKKLKMPVQYIKKDGANIADVISTNIVGKKWTTSDYINRFAAEGNKNYIQLQNFLSLAREKGFAPSVALAIAKGSATKNRYYMYEDGKIRKHNAQCGSKRLYSVGDTLQMGEFQMDSMSSAINRMNIILKFAEWEFYSKSGFVLALIQCMRIKEFDVKRLLESARHHRRKFTNEATTDNFAQMIEEVYNYRRKNKLSIVHNPQRRK